MSEYQAINCQQAVQQYCNYGYDPALYENYSDCMDNKPCRSDSFSKCGDSFDSFIDRYKKNFIIGLGIRPEQFDEYWDYTAEEELAFYRSWNIACEENAQYLHSKALDLPRGLTYSYFNKQLSRISGNFTRYFTGKYPEEFFDTYTRQELPAASPVYSEHDAGEGLTNKKIFLLGGLILGIMLLKK